FLVEHVAQVPGGHFVQTPGDPDALLVGVRQPGGGWQDHQGDAVARLERADYLDVVHRIFATPETLLVEDWYDGSTWEEPACWYYTDVDCAPAEITVRSAFLKVDAQNPYQPRPYPDNEVLRDEDGEPIRVAYATRDDLV